MSRGKYLSLEEARKLDRIEQFAKEHPSKGDRERFNRLLHEMSKTISLSAETSFPLNGASSNETQTHRDTSKDADG